MTLNAFLTNKCILWFIFQDIIDTWKKLKKVIPIHAYNIAYYTKTYNKAVYVKPVVS